MAHDENGVPRLRRSGDAGHLGQTWKTLVRAARYWRAMRFTTAASKRLIDSTVTVDGVVGSNFASTWLVPVS